MKLIGLARLGRDAEVRFTTSGDPVATLALAYNYGKKENGSQPSQWIDAALWGKRAESLAPYLLKGTQLCVTLSDVHVREYQAKDGTTKATLSAKVDDLEFAGSRPAEEAKPKPEKPKVSHPGFEDMTDDIPF